MMPRKDAKQQLQAGKAQAGHYDTISVRYVKDSPHGLVGEMVNKSSSVARELVARGLAEYVFPYEARLAAGTQTKAARVKEAMLAILRASGKLECSPVTLGGHSKDESPEDESPLKGGERASHWS